MTNTHRVRINEYFQQIQATDTVTLWQAMYFLHVALFCAEGRKLTKFEKEDIRDIRQMIKGL